MRNLLIFLHSSVVVFDRVYHASRLSRHVLESCDQVDVPTKDVLDLRFSKTENLWIVRDSK